MALAWVVAAAPYQSFLRVSSQRVQRDVRRSVFQIRACVGSLSPPTVADQKAEVLRQLRVIIDPDLGRDIVSLGFVKNLVVESDPEHVAKFVVTFDVELTTPACPVKENFRSDCVAVVQSLPWVSRAIARMTAQAPASQDQSGAMALSKVGAIVAIASCKGGVGKSTTAVNLAFTLAAQGARVGLMDADIYGPSLPTLVHPETQLVEFEDSLIKPMMYGGVKLMSYGYVNGETAVMRGPMIATLVSQLLTTTDWGEIDYLLIDMPPGTGDVQITLGQVANIDAAVIVTTPQRLAFVDVVKGIQMFEKVNIPSIAVVENMAYFTAPESGVRHRIFGEGFAERLKRDFGIENSFPVPIDPLVSQKSDSGIPFVVSCPDSESAQVYQEIAASVVQELAKIRFGGRKFPEVTFSKETGNIEIRIDGTLSESIWPADLRRKCRCAVCVDEMTGRPILDPRDVDDGVQPTSISPVGNYAVQVSQRTAHE